MNNYARLNHVKADGNVTGSNQDAALVRLIERVSRGFDHLLERQFYALSAVAFFDGDGSPRLHTGDMISLSEAAVDLTGALTYGTVLTPSTDYWLTPDNPLPHEPYRGIELNQWSALCRWFPVGRRRVKLTGVWGYSYETEDTGLTGTLSDASDTTITASADASAIVFAGDTLVIESEQVTVTSVASTTITVARGINGTTAGGHAGKALLLRRYPRDLEEATLLQVMRLFRQQQTGGAEQFGVDGGMSFSSLYPVIRDLVAPLALSPVGYA